MTRLQLDWRDIGPERSAGAASAHGDTPDRQRHHHLRASDDRDVPQSAIVPNA
jgi:hypothetical protein